MTREAADLLDGKRPVFGCRIQIRVVKKWAAQEEWDALPDCWPCVRSRPF